MQNDGLSTGVQDGVHHAAPAVGSKHHFVHGTEEKREIGASIGEESQAIFAETPTPEIPFDEDVDQATEAEGGGRGYKIYNMKCKPTHEQATKETRLYLAVGLTMIIVGFSVAAGVFCRMGRCSSSSASSHDFGSRGTELTHVINKASISGKDVNNPPMSGPEEECALEWLVEDPSNLLISDNNFSSTIPSQISLLSNLKNFGATNNALSGTLDCISRLTSLQAFLGDNNMLSRTLPEFRVHSNLVTLILISNRLHGTITTYFSTITSLEELLLATNQLTGPITNALSTMRGLRISSLTTTA